MGSTSLLGKIFVAGMRENGAGRAGKGSRETNCKRENTRWPFEGITRLLLQAERILQMRQAGEISCTGCSYLFQIPQYEYDYTAFWGGS